MPAPVAHPKTGVFQLRIAVPADLRTKAKGERIVLTIDGQHKTVLIGTHVKVSLGTKDAAEAKRRFAVALAQVENVWQSLRSGPVNLSTTQRRAIAGDVYRRLVADNRSEPGEASRWKANGELIERYLDLKLDADQRHSILDLLAGNQADEALEARGLRITDECRHDLLEDVGRAMRDAFGNLEGMALIDYSERRYPKWEGGDVQSKPAETITFKQIIDDEEKSRNLGKSAKGANQRTFVKFRRQAKSLTDFRKNEDATSLSKQEITDWVVAQQTEGELQNISIVDALTNVRTIWRWGRKKHESLFPSADPFEHVEKPSVAQVPSHERTYTIAEAKSILTASRSQADKEKRWLPFLLSFSGARVSEVANLTGKDFFETFGRHFFKVTTTGGRSLKTSASERTIPVHPWLIKDGFLEFVKTRGEGRLFTFDAGKKIWKWVREDLKIDRENLGANHGWRHLFEDMLTNAGVDADARAYLTGRATGSSRDKYGRSEAMLPGLAREMDKLPALLDWNPEAPKRKRPRKAVQRS